ncbi:uncharacterized protein PITG_20531 [Phytophthora infestans T30-4]|uniref:Uncharacterized protein n=1 Tax=Phytophthora infestans (strain T30-4) TaxID=403677 RepID=D0P274_PHYIT|nr:uncharacterized protein PITG_20531 [Phytophthora infestans T30-4]EEY55825.1 hypothetical protein PITG_20531 [Phytophthora infestans T30-4]|eukprot:XP_002895596.1 hypothetical protein PITG_20531 [Phytophthora infestans T30-4]
MMQPSNVDFQNAMYNEVYSRRMLPLPYDPALRGLRITNIFRVANLRVQAVGISQIRTILLRSCNLRPGGFGFDYRADRVLVTRLERIEHVVHIHETSGPILSYRWH